MWEIFKIHLQSPKHDSSAYEWKVMSFVSHRPSSSALIQSPLLLRLGDLQRLKVSLFCGQEFSLLCNEVSHLFFAFSPPKYQFDYSHSRVWFSNKFNYCPKSYNYFLWFLARERCSFSHPKIINFNICEIQIFLGALLILSRSSEEWNKRAHISTLRSHMARERGDDDNRTKKIINKQAIRNRHLVEIKTHTRVETTTSRYYFFSYFSRHTKRIVWCENKLR